MSTCDLEEQDKPVKLFVIWGDVSRGGRSRMGAGSSLFREFFGKPCRAAVSELSWDATSEIRTMEKLLTVSRWLIVDGGRWLLSKR